MSKTTNYSFQKLDVDGQQLEPGDYNTMLDAIDTALASAAAATNFASITGSDTSLDINGLAGATGGSVNRTGGTSSTSGTAGGALTDTGGTPGATGVGGAVNAVGGIGGATSGAGGAINNTGGAGTNGNAAGGAVINTGGAGQGSAAGGAVTDVGGAGGATGAGGAVSMTGGAGGATSGAGGNATVAGGAGTNGNANGGAVIIAPGAKNGSGLDGAVYLRGRVTLRKQGAPTAKTVTAAITAAELVTGIITTTGVTAPSIHQLPTGTLLKAEFPNIADGEGFEFSLINTGTGASDDATITVNTDVTIVGSPTVGSLTDATIIAGSGRFFARFTTGTTWIVYRLA